MFKQMLKACALFLFVLPVSMLAADATSAPHLTAGQIVERNVSARGGLSTWRSVRNMTMYGTMDAGKGVELPFTLEMMRPRKTRLEIKFDGKTAIQVYDGDNGWKQRPFLGHSDAEPFTPEEKRLASMQTDLDGPLIDYAAKGTKVEIEGMEKVEDRDAFKLKVTLKNEQVRHVWVDAQTFLEVKIDGSRRLDGRMHLVETYFRDYKSTNGLTLPYLMETRVEGVKGSEKITVESFAVNRDLSAAAFSKPQ